MDLSPVVAIHLIQNYLREGGGISRFIISMYLYPGPGTSFTFIDAMYPTGSKIFPDFPYYLKFPQKNLV